MKISGLIDPIIDNFHPWRAGLAMTAAALVICGAWALADDTPGPTFVALARCAVLPLVLPLVHTAVRFLADISRWTWERGYWRSKPYLPETKPDPRPVIVDSAPATSGAIAYNVNGQPQPSIMRPTEAEAHEMAWRAACIAFLQAGYELGKWTIREMVDAGIVTDPEWRLVTGVLSGAGLLTTTKGGTAPYPDYRAALAALRHGKALPLPEESAPRIPQTHTQHAHTQPTHAEEPG
jgi:hypothetical protein